ncbi:MAG TPA: cytochrome c oxidase subunit II [Ktedonobacteraceae bacterium]|nr:cytochrome c oxidase subunit II [Ktedonobacteraceae bacterium]
MPKFRGVKRWATILSALFLSSILLAACDQNTPSILNPKGPVAAKEAGLFWFILVVATIVFVVVEGMLIYSIVRFRERPNSPAPRQIHGNNTIEMIWTIVPSLFLFAVLIGTIYTMFNLSDISGQGRTLQITVVGHQWWWEFDYTNDGIVTADELVVPVGTVIHTTLESQNVIHSFWIPQITGKTDVVPGHSNDKLFKADTIGTYRGICTEFCGLQHAHMSFLLVVKSQSEYISWLHNQQQAAQTPTSGAALAGYKLFTGSGGCVSCHGIVGVNLNSSDLQHLTAKYGGITPVGPNLTHFATRTSIAGLVLSWNPQSCVVSTDSSGNAVIQNQSACGLYQWLHDPQGVKPGNDMQIRQLSDTEVAELVAYLEALN